jgi:excinuclease UvrABC ATPase subunit
MTARQQTIAKELLKEIRTRIAFILDVGLIIWRLTVRQKV